MSHDDGGNGNVRAPVVAEPVDGRWPAPSVLGVVQWFQMGEHEAVEQALAGLRALRIGELRTGISWADWHRPGAEDWFGWLLPRLASEVRLLPCFLYTPPSLALEPSTSAPPRRLKDYADFLDLMVGRFGHSFDWVELWNEPNNMSEWDWSLDPGWRLFAEMIAGAAYWMHHLGKRTVLGGMSPIDPGWLQAMFDLGAMSDIDAVGVHGFPNWSTRCWQGWPDPVARVRRVLDDNGSRAEVWITETGYSTWRHQEHEQLRSLVAAAAAPVERLYWYSLSDLSPELPTIDGFHMDDREYHFGIRRCDGSPKLLYRIWEAQGLEGVRRTAEWGRGAGRHLERHALVTGGAGFIGANLAHRLASSGRDVLVYDNLSRPGVEENLRWLRREHGDRVRVEIADVRDRYALRRALAGAEQVYHFAAQVAVTSSVGDPAEDFAVNAGGTLNLLEELRRLAEPPPLVFTSTNKVYGGLEGLEVRRDGSRYEPVEPRLRDRGIAESEPLDFRSPYGCSKGTADQYVLDYARVYGLAAVVFRMSCIYGPRQFGTEDQGWVAHFLMRSLAGEPITLYGDGLQVRDVLFVDDLVNALVLAQQQATALAGRAFNIGGGPASAVSLLELLRLIAELYSVEPPLEFDRWRPGDQRYYVTDWRAFAEATGWTPRVGVVEGLRRLGDWLMECGRAPRVDAVGLGAGAVGAGGGRRAAP